MTTIRSLRVLDLRFPTSAQRDGSDAMNPDPDYSAAYLVLETDQPALQGHGLTFTIGRGNEICCAAIRALEHLVIGLDLAWITRDMGRFWRHITSDSQLRWIGPDKGAIHLATGALVNAVWDLWAKAEGQPLWRLVAQMSPEELVRTIDFRYLSDCITPEQALALLRERAVGKQERIADLLANGYPCYTTSAGWLGYDDDKLRRLAQQAVDAGFRHLKLKVGRDLQDDIRRLRIARQVLGPERQLMLDANQVWEVDQAIAWLQQLAFAKPWFIEEPTSPDDVEGHRRIRQALSGVMQVATGEMCQNRILFKQFIMREAIDVVQIDACRLGGVNEVLAVLLMAAKHGLKVCPHAGGVGLCEYVQHLAMIDYLCIAGSKQGRVIEYVDHLHEHFVDPCVIRNAAYMPPQRPGYSIEMKPHTLATHQHHG
ncbi:L-fuconate dehydratase [Verminephrobacter eiseniae]|uniref:Mandelate racemase/muconate lactonizing enzyme, C-terminal domain protein n=1 Tax=Verminephrobacter eiseniae (strain EF01-2) TaxID=391735 RepID=A1WGV3_VEREI|nr:L-fuconate dehydratase [Verminephrobacter eiseniae]ABM56860.1 Mandelate racemase/muconate lactonizing enzyme, C-terminal domain protein [Verminephrobacter eiseniae EF01-2]MCW5287207.1 L-fuconate dehydratase [Verminephrobacter eiseniae]MCW5305506.1 L-fuconate dehydratase [Verminephrobacter eiseniae]MCW8180863.1 L-fuconate dehydratase [Verminephrobacter eiseniae]MCW8192583.1 L-fuconate dehydratase [Verminephrobacter eiseniae]